MRMSWLLLRQSLEIRPTFITCFPTFDPWIDRVGLVRNHPKTSLLWTCLSFALDATSNERPKFGPEMFLHMTQLVASFIPSLFPKKPSLAFGNLVMHDGKTSTSHKSKGYFGQKLNNPESLLGISTSMFMPQKTKILGIQSSQRFFNIFPASKNLEFPEFPCPGDIPRRGPEAS